jgi:uncharacterized protein
VDFLTLVIAALLVGASVAIYGRLFRGVYLSHRGKVSGDQFTRLDVYFVFIIVLYILLMSFQTVTSARPLSTRRVDTSLLIIGVLIQWSVILLPILISFTLRHMRPTALFGLDTLRFRKVVLLGVGLLLAALPVIALSSVIVSSIFHFSPQRDSQEIVRVFENAASPSQKIPIIVLAVVLAPMIEEFVFRGFVYGVLKRHFGAFASLLFTGILFAVVHLHPPSLVPLFLLACALTIAYEFSGSLLVPMTMHAFFNGLTLVGVFFARS